MKLEGSDDRLSKSTKYQPFYVDLIVFVVRLMSRKGKAVTFETLVPTLVNADRWGG